MHYMQLKDPTNLPERREDSSEIVKGGNINKVLWKITTDELVPLGFIITIRRI